MLIKMSRLMILTFLNSSAGQWWGRLTRAWVPILAGRIQLLKFKINLREAYLRFWSNDCYWPGDEDCSSLSLASCFRPLTMRTSAGKLIPRSEEYVLRASMTSRFSAASCCFERTAIFVRSVSDISDRNVQKFSTEIDASIENRNSRSDGAATPASERT